MLHLKPYSGAGPNLSWRSSLQILGGGNDPVSGPSRSYRSWHCRSRTSCAASTRSCARPGRRCGPEHPLRQREDEHQDCSRARPDADQERDGKNLSPRERAGKLGRIDDVMAGLAFRVTMAMLMVVMIVDYGRDYNGHVRRGGDGDRGPRRVTARDSCRRRKIAMSWVVRSQAPTSAIMA